VLCSRERAAKTLYFFLHAAGLASRRTGAGLEQFFCSNAATLRFDWLRTVSMTAYINSRQSLGGEGTKYSCSFKSLNFFFKTLTFSRPKFSSENGSADVQASPEAGDPEVVQASRVPAAPGRVQVPRRPVIGARRPARVEPVDRENSGSFAAEGAGVLHPDEGRSREGRAGEF